MPRDTADRSLRRLIADLAGLGDADIQDILSELDLGERTKVEALLASYAGVDSAEAPRPGKEAHPKINTKGLSSWLAGRIHAGAPADELGSAPLLRALADRLARRGPRLAAVMTPAAIEALRASAAAVQGHVPSRAAPLLGWWKPLAKQVSVGAPA